MAARIVHYGCVRNFWDLTRLQPELNGSEVVTKVQDIFRMDPAGCNKLYPAGCNKLDPAGFNKLDPAGCNKLDPAGCNKLDPAGCNKLDPAGVTNWIKDM